MHGRTRANRSSRVILQTAAHFQPTLSSVNTRDDEDDAKAHYGCRRVHDRHLLLRLRQCRNGFGQALGAGVNGPRRQKCRTIRSWAINYRTAESVSEPFFLDRACLCQPRSDVVIDSKEIRWIVFLLDGGQARKVVAEGTVNDFVGFDVERRQKMRVCREGPKRLLHPRAPTPDGRSSRPDRSTAR